MSGRTLLLTSAVALSLVAAPAAAQDPAGKAPASAPRADPAPAASGPDFPAGAEVLSVDGEPLGVLAYVGALGGERLLHIRRPDGTVTTAPAVVASRGERAVVLEWTRAEFENPVRPPVAVEVVAVPSPSQ